VPLNGVLGDDELISDSLVRSASQSAPQHLNFSRREVVRGKVFGHLLRDLDRYPRLQEPTEWKKKALHRSLRQAQGQSVA
jgi:hypothetical protein